MVGGDRSYDVLPDLTNPGFGKESDPYNTQTEDAANPDPSIDPREGFIPLDSQAMSSTVSTKKIVQPGTEQLVKYTKLYFPDEDCTQIEAIQINQAIPSNPTIYTIFTMPPLTRGIIRYIGLDSNEFADRTFTFLLNGIPVAGFGNFQGQIGTIQRPFDTFLIIPAQNTLTLSLATVSTAGANFISYRFKGWFWPMSMEGKQTIVEEYGLTDPEEEGLI